jgi:hypothetical protein
MDYNKACNILNLKPHFTHSELRKNYHILALQYHPDKNENENASEIFKQIVEAYNYLNEFSNKNINRESNNDNIEITYAKLIADFINIISTSDIQLLEIFKNDCLEYSLSIINSLDKSILLILSNYINIFYRIFNISKESLETIVNTIKNRLKKTNVYILNPSLKNIKNNEVYCLEHEGETIYIPLWHRELIYNDITIKCIPDLPENIEIDDDNNIHYKVFIDNAKLFEKATIDIDLCGDNYSVPIEKLYIKHYQTYILKECGISQINSTNILDIDKKTDIVVHIFIN